MHYELKYKHEVCFKAKIVCMAGLIVNSKAKNLNSLYKARTTESKKF